MKKISKKSIIALVATLTTMFSIAVVTFAAWTYNYHYDSAGSVSVQLCVGYDDEDDNRSNFVGYAEVVTGENCYANMDGWARYSVMGVSQYSYIVGEMDDDTYRQVSVRGKNYINKISCDFRVVSDDGICVKTLTK